MLTFGSKLPAKHPPLPKGWVLAIAFALNGYLDGGSGNIAFASADDLLS